MLNDLDFAPTHERADYCDAADEAAPLAPPTVSEADLVRWENDPWF